MNSYVSKQASALQQETIDHRSTLQCCALHHVWREILLMHLAAVATFFIALSLYAEVCTNSFILAFAGAFVWFCC